MKGIAHARIVLHATQLCSKDMLETRLMELLHHIN